MSKYERCNAVGFLGEARGPERSNLSCIITRTKETQLLSYILLSSSRACYQHCRLTCS